VRSPQHAEEAEFNMDRPSERMLIVSIIIPVYNDEKHVARAIESALAQTLKEVEVIVVDDGSTDGTPDVLRKYEGRIIQIRQDNQGCPAALNTGIEASQGRYICFLGSDDTLMPKKAELQVAALERNPDAGLCYSGWLDIDLRDGRVLADHSNPKPERDPASDLFPPHFCAFAALIRAEWLEKVRGLDEHMRCVEDSDLWWRLWAAGCRFVRVEGALGCYTMRADSKSRDIAVHSLYAMYAYKKHFAAMGRKAPRALRARKLSYLWTITAGYHLHQKQYALAEEAVRCAFRYNRQLLRDVRFWYNVLLVGTCERFPRSDASNARRDEICSHKCAELVRTIRRALTKLPYDRKAELSRQEMSALAYVISRFSEIRNRSWVARWWLLKSLLFGRGKLPTGAHRRPATKMLIGASLSESTSWLLHFFRRGSGQVTAAESDRM